MLEKLFSYIDPSPAQPGDGPLKNYPLAIQPNMSVRGWPCQAGSLALENYIALEDATAIEHLRAARAILIGSTHMAELGFGLDGDTAAQAIAAEQCGVSLLSDTLGEARHAACQAERYGFKPSYGLISRFGLIGLIPSMEGYGVIAKTPREIAEIVSVLAVPDERDPSMIQTQVFTGINMDNQMDSVKTIGVIRESKNMLQSEGLKAFQAALSRLEKTGIHIQEICLPDYILFRTVHQTIGSTEASSSAGKYDSVRYGHRTANAENWNEMYCKSRGESFGVLVKSYLFQGAYFQFKNYPAFEKACRIRRRLVQQTAALYESVDFIACPTLCSPSNSKNADTVDEVYDRFALTLPANVTGQPSLQIPGYAVADGLDFGLQLMAAHRDDARLLAFTAQLHI